MAAPMRKHVLGKIWLNYREWLSSKNSVTFCRMLSIRKHVSEVLEGNKLTGQEITIKGWVTAVRNHKEVTFLNISDGSCLKPIQVVSSPEKAEGVMFGSSVSVEGLVKESPSSGQPVEMTAEKIHVIGSCDTVEYPFKAKERHTADYCRGFLHLRHRTNFFGALLRARNTATMAVHQYFQTNGFCLVNTPIITSGDAEGAGEVFTVQPARSGGPGAMTEESRPLLGHFFSHPAYLTVSGQLHLEAVSGGFSKAYTFGPTFRAETSKGRYHLSEFYMVEAELAFTDSLEDILQVMEDLVKVSAGRLLEQAGNDVDLFHRHVSPGHRNLVDGILSSNFHRITYDDAVTILLGNNEKFQFKVTWGCDLQKEHEQYLVSHFNNIPVFVTDFPKELKPFYARENDDGKTVSAVDLLFPGVGELFGGSLREERYDILKERLERAKMADEYSWYLDIRKYGAVPHGGFGMGFERYLQALLGIPNIKDTIPFPRSWKNCKM